MEGAFVRVGRSKKPVISISEYFADGTCTVVMEATTPNGYCITRQARVPLKHISLPTPVDNEIRECRQLVNALGTLIPVEMGDLLPLSDIERRAFVRARLVDAGYESLNEMKNALRRQATCRADLLKIIPIIHILNTELLAGVDARLPFRKAAMHLYSQRGDAGNQN